MEESQEVLVESITPEQFLQAMAGQHVQGTPSGTAYVVPKREPVPGEDLLTQRVRISFEFDVTCNTSPILSSGNNDDVKGYDLALLKQFLLADKDRLLDMLMDTIGIELGLNSCETFIAMFLPGITFGNGILERRLFNPAIDTLDGPEGEYWRNIRDEPHDRRYGDILSICTETLFECFKAEFVRSHYETI